MQTKSKANIELAAQVVIAIAVVVAAGALVKRTFSPAYAPAAGPRITAGEHLDIANVNWAQNEKSLVFFLKKDCQYCTLSAPFYRQLIEEATKRNVKCIAVFPNTLGEARKYLQYLDLPIENVQTASLAAYKITGTPTVLFVDNQGTVRSTWFGAAVDREAEMRSKLIELFEAKID